MEPESQHEGEGQARKVLRTGTFLHTSCPHCGADLVEDRYIHLRILGPNQEEGELMLSPRFNVFEKRSTIELPAGAEVRDLQCPHCHASLLADPWRCELCNALTAGVHVEAVRVGFGLLFCTRVGCHWHGVTEEDRDRIDLDHGDSVDS